MSPGGYQRPQNAVSYPALEDFGRDIRVGFARWKVYMNLQPPTLNHRTPIEVKVWALAERLHMGKRHVISALNWLVAEGYLIECERGDRHVRRLMLEYEMATPAADDASQFHKGTVPPAA